MEPHAQRDLKILTELARGAPVTQRGLAEQLAIAEKSRLTYEYMDYSLQLYRQTRRALREALGPLAQEGPCRVVLYGTGEPAELAYLTVRELGLELIGVVDGDPRGGTFLGLPVLPLADLHRDDVDLIIVATFAPADGAIHALTGQGIPREKIVSLRGAK